VAHDRTAFVSFAEYIERMKEGEDAIYYIAGSSVEEVEKSPFV
jgi:HSP90 family molecular chaperone